MLTEILDVKQNLKDNYRRWFTDDFFDLIVWYKNGPKSVKIGFQLCYNKNTPQEKSLTWRKNQGYMHNAVDQGENVGQNKATPILILDGAFNKNNISECFTKMAGNIDQEIFKYVFKKIKLYKNDL